MKKNKLNQNSFKTRVRNLVLLGKTNREIALILGKAQGQINYVVAGLGISVDMVESIEEENGIEIKKIKPGYALGGEPYHNKRY